MGEVIPNLTRETTHPATTLTMGEGGGEREGRLGLKTTTPMDTALKLWGMNAVHTYTSHTNQTGDRKKAHF